MRDDPVSRKLREHVCQRAVAGMDMPLARLLLAKGKAFQGVAFEGRKGEKRRCFSNALKLAEKLGFRYAEGYGLSGSLLARGLALPVEHAWCVDHEGRAIDPTWDRPETCFYLGIEFDVRDVWKRVASTGTFGVFHSGRAAVPDYAFMQSLMPELAPGKVHEEFLSAAEADVYAPTP